MAKIPVKLILDTAKTHGPTVGKFLKENWKETAVVVGGLGKAREYIINKKETKKNSEKIHFRKNHYSHYKTTILKELDNKKRASFFNM